MNAPLCSMSSTGSPASRASSIASTRPDGVERWAASTAHWQPWHQAKPTIRARVITLDGQEHQIDQKLLTDAAKRSGDNQVFDDSRTLEGPLPAVAIGAVIEEEITVRDEKPFFSAGSVYSRVHRPADAGVAHAHHHRRAGVAAAQTPHAVAAAGGRCRRFAPTAASPGRSSTA